MELPRRIDWWRVITDLNYAGFSNGRIADELLVSKSWVASVKNDGTEPRYRDGDMLLALWVRATGKQVQDAPRGLASGDGARERARLACR